MKIEEIKILKLVRKLPNFELCPTWNVIHDLVFKIIEINGENLLLDFSHTEKEIFFEHKKIKKYLKVKHAKDSKFTIYYDNYKLTFTFSEELKGYPSIHYSDGDLNVKNAQLLVFVVKVDTEISQSKKSNRIDISKKQHFLPRVYLKNFANDKGCISVFTSIENEIQEFHFDEKKKPIFFRDYLYDYYGYGGQYLEKDFFSKRQEAKFNKNILPVINRETVNRNCKNFWIKFFVSLSLRHPSIINPWRAEIFARLTWHANNLDTDKFANLFNENLKNKLIRCINAYVKTFNNRDIFFLHAPLGRNFIASDSAMIKTSKKKCERLKCGDIDCDVYFVLSSKLLIWLPVKRRLFESQDQDISIDKLEYLNKIIALNSEQFFFGNFDEIKKLNVVPKTLEQKTKEVFARNNLSYK